LEGFPTNSAAGRHGTYAVQNGVLRVTAGNYDGFSLEEATYIALLVSILNISHASVALHGDRVNENTKSVISDVVNFTDDTQPLYYVQHLNGNDHTFQKTLLSGDGLTYVAFEGPSRPSSMERSVVKQIGADIIGTTTISILYILRYLGVSVSAHLNSISDAVTNDVVTAKVDLNVESALVPLKRGNQLHYEEVVESAAFVSTQVNSIGHPTTAILDFNLVLPLEQDSRVQVLHEIPLATIPHANLSTQKKGAKLQLVRLTGATNSALVYLVNGFGHSHESFTTNSATFLIRLFQQLEVKRVYMTSSFVRAIGEDQVPDDAVIALNDHFNFTGENPLIGHNEERWGERFFDMSFVYSNSTLLPPLSTISEQRIISVKCLFANHVRSLQSTCLVNNAIRTFDSKVLGDVGLFEAATVRHSVGKLECVTLGVAFDAHEIGKKPSEHQYKQIVDTLIASIAI
jgi:purine nucleoside phosphorylase